MTVGTSILLLSTVLQIAAAVFAIRLNALTGWRAPWLLFTGAVLLMALRRIITAIHVLENPLFEPDLESEMVALLISALMLAGVLLIERMFRAMLADSRALAESRARVEGLMNHVTDGIVTADSRGVIESFNRGAERIFGYTGDEVIGRQVGMLMPDSERARHAEDIRNYFETGRGGIVGGAPRELLVRRKDGSNLPIELTIGEMRAADERVFVGVMRDLSERRIQQSQLQQAEKLKAVGQLTGGIAHDFNNMLTVIIGNLDLLKRQLAGDPRNEPLAQAADRAARRAADLTRRLLAFARRQALSPDATDVNRQVPDIVELIRRTMGADIEIETVLGAGLWPAMVDRGQLESAILNLAINARDAMPDGGKLTIETANAVLDESYARAHDEVQPGRYVMLAVSDTGEGMTCEVAARAFEPFFTTKEAGRGTGLGLSMIYGFVKQSGGHVKIYSEPMIGTTVKLYLPRAAGVAASSERDRAGRQPVPAGNESILVVEDDPDVRAFAVAALSDLGFDIHQAPDGPAALALLDRLPRLDMLFTDVVLPRGMSGRDVAEKVRERFPDVCVLYTSGYTRNAVVHQGRLDPDIDLLAKPFTRETLVTRVRARLDAQKAGRPGR